MNTTTEVLPCDRLHGVPVSPSSSKKPPKAQLKVGIKICIAYALHAVPHFSHVKSGLGFIRLSPGILNSFVGVLPNPMPLPAAMLAEQVYSELLSDTRSS